MVRVVSLCLILVVIALVLQDTDAQGLLSGIGMAYTAVRRGTRMVRRLMYGMGTVSKMYDTIDGSLRSDVLQEKDSLVIVDETRDVRVPASVGLSGSAGDGDIVKVSPGNPSKPKDLTQNADDSNEFTKYLKEIDSIANAKGPNQKHNMVSRERKQDVSSCRARKQKLQDQKESTQDIEDSLTCGNLSLNSANSSLPITEMTNCCGTHKSCLALACRRIETTHCNKQLRSCFKSICDLITVDKTEKKSCRVAIKLLYYSAKISSKKTSVPITISQKPIQADANHGKPFHAKQKPVKASATQARTRNSSRHLKTQTKTEGKSSERARGRG